MSLNPSSFCGVIQATLHNLSDPHCHLLMGIIIPNSHDLFGRESYIYLIIKYLLRLTMHQALEI